MLGKIARSGKGSLARTEVREARPLAWDRFSMAYLRALRRAGISEAFGRPSINRVWLPNIFPHPNPLPRGSAGEEARYSALLTFVVHWLCRLGLGVRVEGSFNIEQ